MMGAAPERVDPRVAQSRRIICEAALDAFAEHGFDGMTIEGVASRAGVGKSTIYRHWPNRVALLEDAIRTMPDPADSNRDPGSSARDHVFTYLTALEETINASKWSAVLPAMVHAAQRSDEVEGIQVRFGKERRNRLEAILRSGVESGEFATDSDVEILAKALVGPIFLARLMQRSRTPADHIGRLVDQLLGTGSDAS